MKKAITFIIIITFTLLLISCGAAYHLRKAERQIRKAQIKGAIINSDTVFKNVPFITDRFIHDTIVNRMVITDTLTIDHIRYKVKLKYDTLHHTEFVQVECKPDTIIREVPIQITRTIHAPPHDSWYWYAGLNLLVFMFLLALRKRRK